MAIRAGRIAGIRTHLGKLERASGSIPHPKGEIAVALTKQAQQLRAEITLPTGVGEVFEWRGFNRKLSSGHNMFTAVPR